MPERLEEPTVKPFRWPPDYCAPPKFVPHWLFPDTWEDRSDA
jgi:hypothetical protein